MQEALKENKQSESLIVEWVKSKHKYDHITIKQVKPDYYRTNIYTQSGDVVKCMNLVKSYYLFVKDKVEDKTL